MPLLEFEPTISAGKWLQTYALDCAATGINPNVIRVIKSRGMRSVTHIENEKCMQMLIRILWESKALGGLNDYIKTDL